MLPIDSRDLFLKKKLGKKGAQKRRVGKEERRRRRQRQSKEWEMKVGKERGVGEKGRKVALSLRWNPRGDLLEKGGRKDRERRVCERSYVGK